MFFSPSRGVVYYTMNRRRLCTKFITSSPVYLGVSRLLRYNEGYRKKHAREEIGV